MGEGGGPSRCTTSFSGRNAMVAGDKVYTPMWETLAIKFEPIYLCRKILSLTNKPEKS